MSIYLDSEGYIPYTYLIGWSHYNKWYYGSETGFIKKANPKNLWTTYFTSSDYVKAFRQKYGEPDVIQVRKTFSSKESTLMWESTVLKRINAIQSAKWLNKGNGGPKFTCVMTGDENPSKRLDVRQKISQKLSGRTFSDSAKEKMRQAKIGLNKGKSYEEIYGIEAAKNLRQSRSSSMKGRKKTQTQIEATKRACSKWWRVYPPNDLPIIIQNLNGYCKERGLDVATMCGIAYHPFNNDGRFRFHLGHRVEPLTGPEDTSTLVENIQQNMISDKKTKIYKIIYPDGIEEIIRGLGEFAKQMGWPSVALYDVKDKICANGEPRKYKGFVVKTIA